jgi:hypothetical protein
MTRTYSSCPTRRQCGKIEGSLSTVFDSTPGPLERSGLFLPHVRSPKAEAIFDRDDRAADETPRNRTNKGRCWRGLCDGEGECGHA